MNIEERVAVRGICDVTKLSLSELRFNSVQTRDKLIVTNNTRRCNFLDQRSKSVKSRYGSDVHTQVAWWPLLAMMVKRAVNTEDKQ